MNILFWLEPHFELASPGIMATWLDWYERLAATIAGTVIGSQARIVALDTPLILHRPNASSSEVVTLSQGELRANWMIDGDAFMALEHDTLPSPQVEQLQAILLQRLSGFNPDFLFLLHQQPWLRRLFPDTVFVNIEVGWTSRPPFPLSWHLDIGGAGKGRILAQHADNLLSDIGLDATARAWLDDICLMARKTLHSPQAEAPVLALREKYEQVVLLPLGLFDRYDGHTSLFCVLDEYLGRMDGKTSYILTQHPVRGILTPEQMAYLSSRYPWLADGSGLGSQNLLPLVDRVVADFSTLATQALFFGTEAISIRRSLRSFPTETFLRNPLADLLQSADTDKRQRALYWLLRCYAVPERRLFDGAWLSAFLEDARSALASGRAWEAYAQPSANTDDWAPACWRPPVGLPSIETAPPLPSTNSSAKDTKMNDDRVAYERAVAALAAGNTEDAVTTLSRLAESGTDLWEVYNDLGALAVQQADLDTAITLFEFAVARESIPGPARLHLAQTQEMVGQWLAALETLSPLLRSNREFPEALPTLRRLLGVLPELPPISWARLLADLQAPNADMRSRLDETQNLRQQVASLEHENRGLNNRLRSLETDGDGDVNSARYWFPSTGAYGSPPPACVFHACTKLYNSIRIQFETPGAHTLHSVTSTDKRLLASVTSAQESHNSVVFTVQLLVSDDNFPSDMVLEFGLSSSAQCVPVRISLSQIASRAKRKGGLLIERFNTMLSTMPSVKLLDIGGRARSGLLRASSYPNSQVTVLDILAAPGVDVVCDAHRMSEVLEHSAFDAACSMFVFEHLVMPWKVALEINRVLRVGGLALIVTHQTIGMHDLPWDYFRFSDSAWKGLFNEYTGFEILDTDLSSVQHIIPLVYEDRCREAEKTAGFEYSTVLVRKVSETKLDWPLGANDVVSGNYPA